MNENNQNASLNKKKAIDDLILLHPNYDFSKSVYKGSLNKIIFYCNIHGKQSKRYTNLKNGTACILCSNEKLSKLNMLDEKKAIDDLILLHPNYDFSKSVYIDSGSKITYICPEHGLNNVFYNNLKAGKGCLSCARKLSAKNYYENKKTIIYYIKIENDFFIQYKIGVCLKKRFTSENAIKNRYHTEIKNKIKIEILDFKLYENGIEAYDLEQLIIKNNQNNLILKENMILDSGFTETFNMNVLNEFILN